VIPPCPDRNYFSDLIDGRCGMRGGGSTKHGFFLALQIAPFRLGDAVKLALITTPVSHRETVHLAQTQRTH